MSDVQADNLKKQIKHQRERARLAESAWQYFTQSPEGQKLYSDLAETCGAHTSAFNPKDNFNPNAAAFRDGMRATFLKIEKLIKEHESSKSQP